MANEPDGQSVMAKRFDFFYWKYAIWKILSGLAIVVLPGIMSMYPEAAKTLALVIAGLKSVDMMLDQSIARLASGKLPIQVPGQNGQNGHGDTQHIQKPPDKI